MTEFDKYMAVDWSGAKGKTHQGIAVAACGRGRLTPTLLCPEGKNWSRREVANVLLNQSEKAEKTLVGFDFSFAPPYGDKGGYFPECGAIPDSVSELWDFIETTGAQAADFYGGHLPEHKELKNYFHCAGYRGRRYEKRLRQTELACIEQGLGRAESIFHLIGPTQVGLASFAGMRMLSYVKKRNPAIAIWPFDKISDKGVTIVEIYSRLFLTHAGYAHHKVRDWPSVDQGIKEFGSFPVTEETRNILPTDHRTDAIISAAGLRHLARQKKYWSPGGNFNTVAKSEGWTFGVA